MIKYSLITFMVHVANAELILHRCPAMLVSAPREVSPDKHNTDLEQFRGSLAFPGIQPCITGCSDYYFDKCWITAGPKQSQP